MSNFYAWSREMLSFVSMALLGEIGSQGCHLTTSKWSPESEYFSKCTNDDGNPGRRVWINVCLAGVTDGGLEHLSSFSGLTRLHADNPGIGDKGLQNLSCLSSLRHLDLFGASKVTSQGCVHLRQARPMCLSLLAGCCALCLPKKALSDRE